MRYRKLGNTNLYISPIGLGCRTIHKLNLEDAINLIRYAVTSGINFIDTANIYGEGRSEEIIGYAIRDIRKRVILATKGCIVKTKDGLYTQDLRPKSIKRALNESLMRLNTDYIDLYQIHYPDPMTPIEDTIKTLTEYVENGVIRYIGLSNFPLNEMRRVVDIYDIPSIQVPYNFLQHKLYDEIRLFCQMKHISIISYTPLLIGLLTEKILDSKFIKKIDMLHIPPRVVEECRKIVEQLHSLAEKTDKSIAHLILNWILNNTVITCVLVGMKSISHIKENLDAISWKMPSYVNEVIIKVINDIRFKLDNEYFIQSIRDTMYNYVGQKVAVIDMGMKIIVPDNVNNGDRIKISWNGEYLGKY